MIVDEYTSEAGARIHICDDCLRSEEEQKKIKAELKALLHNFLVKELEEKNKKNTTA